MSMAIKCDICGDLVERLQAVSIGVDVPKKKEDESTGWTDVDVCLACLSRPARAILEIGCDGLAPLLATRREPS